MENSLVPSRSWGSTIEGSWAAHSAGQLGTVHLGLEGPYLPLGGPEQLCCDSWPVHRLPRACSPLRRTWLKMASPSLEEWSRSLIIASPRLDGI